MENENKTKSKYCSGKVCFNILENFYYVNTLEYGDITIPDKFLNKSFINDIVLIKIKPNSKLGYVQKVIERAEHVNIIGEIDNEHIKVWSLGYYKDFYIGKNHFNHKDVVIFDYNEWIAKSPSIKNVKPYTKTSNKMFVRYNISDSFNQETLDECKDLIFNYKNRVDLTKLKSYTYTENLSSAISFEKTLFGSRLYFHIVDCTENVRTGNSLDDDAYNKGIEIGNLSIFPKEFLNFSRFVEKHDRQAITCIINLDHEYEIIDSSVTRTIINVLNNYDDFDFDFDFDSNIYLNELYIASKAISNNKLYNDNKIESIQTSLEKIVNNLLLEKYKTTYIGYDGKKYIPSDYNEISFINVLTNYVDVFNQRILLKMIDNKKIITGNMFRMCQHLNSKNEIKKIWKI